MNIFEKSLRVVYYARVSTQFESQISSLTNQKNHYEFAIKNAKNWTFSGGYIDEGITGTSAVKRENFLKMISDAKNGKFDLIITKEISRFSRNTLESISYTRELLKYGVGVYFESDGICTLSSDSELRLTIMSAIYQDEVRRISERIKFGFKEAFANKKVLGTGDITGYTKKDGVLSVDDTGAYIVKRIFHLYADKKLGIRQVSKHLADEGILNKNGNPYSFSSIKNILTNPKYKGYYCGKKYENVDFRYAKKVKLDKEKWILEKDENIPQIVSEEIWERANELLNNRSTKNINVNTKHIFSGKIFCEIDKNAYHRVMINGFEAWQCKQKKEKKCNSKTVYTSEIILVLSHILNREINIKDICNALCKIYSSLKKSQKEISGNNFTKSKIYLLSLLNDKIITNDEYDKKIKEIEKRESQTTKTAENNDIKTQIEKIFENSKDDILAEITEKIYVHFENALNVELTVCLTNGSTYTAKYIKKGSKVLSEPIIERA